MLPFRMALLTTTAVAAVSAGGSVVLSFTSAGVVTDSYSGAPEGIFGGTWATKHIVDEDGVLVETPHLFGLHDRQEFINLPDALGGAVGEGFTCTGLTWDGTAFWVANDGRSISGDGTYEPSLVKVSLAGAKLAEIDLYAVYTSSLGSPQGVAYDTSDGTLWVAAGSYVYHLTTAGVDLADGFAFSGVNGIAYDSFRDKLWLGEGTNLTIANKDGSSPTTYVIANAIDHLYYDPLRDYVWNTYGANGVVGKADAVTATAGTLVNTATFQDATAIEGIVLVNGDWWIAHDGYFHGPDGAVIQKNQLQRYRAVSGSGTVEWQASHDPTTPFAYRGYAIQPALTRLSSNPKRFSLWTPTNCTVSGDTFSGPNLLSDGDTILATAGSAIARVSTPFTPAAGPVFMSGFAKKDGTHRYLWIGDRNDTGGGKVATFDLQGGVVVGTTSLLASGIEDWGDHWFIWIAYTRVNASLTSINIAFGQASHTSTWPTITFAGTETLKLWGFEAGQAAFPCSPLFDVTTNSRSADTPTLATSSFDMSAVANTWKIEARTARGSGTQVLFQVDDGSEDNRFRLVRDSSNNIRFIVTVATSEVANLNLGSVANNTSFKVAVSARANNFIGSLNGAASVSDTSGALPTVTTLRYGHSFTGEQWCGTIESLTCEDKSTSGDSLILWSGA